MSGKRRTVESLELRLDGPTELSLDDLYTWVVWQFPRPRRSGLCGAVRPPIANHTWFPALISRRDQRVSVYGHVNQDFATPAEAAAWLENQPL
ncbi:MAG: hypothetical protein PVH65_17545 [Chloroflexota bacterium]|jgi:hypothetical protein